MQEAIAAAIVVLALAMLAAKGWRALRRRCRSKEKADACGTSCKCG